MSSATASASVSFAASRAVGWLDHFGVPYAVHEGHVGMGDGIERLEYDDTGRALLWPGATLLEDRPAVAASMTVNGDPIRVFGRVLNDATALWLLPAHGTGWTPAGNVVGTAGERLASIWRADDGSIYVPFDPDEIRLNMLSERYDALADRAAAAGLRPLAMHTYYRLRSFMPRPVQIWLRRRYAAIQARRQFPHWPVETALHDFLEYVFGLAQSVAAEPVPRIAPWPNGRTWSLVLTHDVETSVGLAALGSVLGLERSLGVRSACNLVPERDYVVSPEQVRALAADGFEVGVHGLHHDGRDLESPATLAKRLPAIRSAADRWGAVGFRSPATHRDWTLMPALGFDYDSSYPDTDPFEPQGGGCCSWLPFFIDGMVELPLTMPQDHTLFTILRHTDETAWVQKAEALRARGGMALIDTHPDYLVDDTMFQAYARLLRRFADDEDVWLALPSEVSAWWRRRAASRIERTPAGWSVTGPAASEARVEFACPQPPTTADVSKETPH